MKNINNFETYINEKINWSNTFKLIKNIFSTKELDESEYEEDDDIITSEIRLQLSILRAENPNKLSDALQKLAKIHNIKLDIDYKSRDLYILTVKCIRKDYNSFYTALKKAIR